MKVAIAYPAFFGSFKRFFPDLEKYSSEKKYDLVIFSGGEDINPQIYREQNTYSDFSPERDQVELDILSSLFNRYSSSNMPYILGVCRGHQLICAYLGAKVVQDLRLILGNPHPSYHEFFPYEYTMAQTFFSTKTGKFMVNSLHHQGVPSRNTIQGMRTTGQYLEISEIAEGKKILTVQSHPEFAGNQQFFDWIKETISSRKDFYQPIKPEKIIDEEPELSKEKRTKKSTGINFISTANYSYKDLNILREEAFEAMRKEKEKQSISIDTGYKYFVPKTIEGSIADLNGDNLEGMAEDENLFDDNSENDDENNEENNDENVD